MTHYFSMAKARRELLYAPVAYPMSETVEWFRSHGYAAPAVSAAAAPSPQQQLLRGLVKTSIALILLLLLGQAAGLRL